MTFDQVYRISFYLMLLFATLTLNVDAVDSRVAMLYPVAVAVVGALAFLTVDRNPKLGVTRTTALGLMFLSFVIIFFEFRYEQSLLMALAHFLVLLQLARMVFAKSVEDDWLLYGLALMQVVVGAVISQSDRLGAILIVWVLLSLWVLGLFMLRREALRARNLPGLIVSGPGGARSREPYPGLFQPAFYDSALRVLLTTLALGGVIFLAMPRSAGSGLPRGNDATTQHLTGFGDEVQLGQLGEILESDAIVMSVVLFGDHDQRLASRDDSLYWRGVTLEDYAHGRWTRQVRREKTFPRPRKIKTIRQVVKLEVTDSDVLFGMRPMLDATSQSSVVPDLNYIDGTIFRNYHRPGVYEYEVVSAADPTVPQPGEFPPGASHERRLLAVPPALRDRLTTLAERIVKDVPAGDVEGRARALEAYLRDSGEFSYTLQMGVANPELDPVEDFLVNRKRGHCEYFASALTLLLRAIGIPARMVNGFKGGDWNELTMVLNVRQKHAHSWVEAFTGPGLNRTALWLRLDATPASEREQSVAKVGGVGANFRQITDLVRYIWVFYIVGFNSERQKALIYDPFWNLVKEAKEGFAMMGQALRETVADLLAFRKPGRIFSPRGFILAFSALLFLVLLVRVAIRLVRRLVRWFRGTDEDAAALLPGVHVYRRLTRLLARGALKRLAAETPREFARRAEVFLSTRSARSGPVADVPGLVVDALYQVRYGRRDLTVTDLEALDARLDALEASFRESQT